MATSLESAAASVTSDLSPGSAIAQPTVAEAVSVTTPIPPILQITAPLIGGGEFDFGAYAGKPLAVWFWAPG